ncbi:cysteine desulfurase family protein [Halobacteriovorax sp. CON-3]|uniref:cysteine desulfurase family protein n=1 Tax=Halobacteriovorax sp. CON-3 TaxID=3157710 RepID=UPI003711349C
MIYLDDNATTPVLPEVMEVMLPYFTEKFANPASRTHEMGREASAAVESARKQLAAIFNLDSKYCIFTSGATEANNMVILGLKKHLKKIGKTKIVTSMFEHKAVLDPCSHLKEEEGFEIIYVKPETNGYIDPEKFRDVIDDNTGLVSLMHVNNELGTVQPIKEVAEIAKEAGALMHVDGAQGFCKLDLDLEDSIDYYTASGHKVYGPKGIGALFINGRKARKVLSPIIFGGGHETGLRSGTLATPLIVGFAEAAKLTRKKFLNKKEIEKRIKLANEIEEEIAKYPNIHINGSIDKKLATTVNFRIDGVNSEALMLRMKDYCLSNGSACTSKDYSPSHVLRSMNITEEQCKSSFRSFISLNLSRLIQSTQ